MRTSNLQREDYAGWKYNWRLKKKWKRTQKDYCKLEFHLEKSFRESLIEISHSLTTFLVKTFP